MMNLLKKHIWEDVKRYLSNSMITHNGRSLAPNRLLFNWQKCKKCGLMKATMKLSGRGRFFRDYKTFYFKVDENNDIIEGGPNVQTVPYGCGYQETVLLHDEDFHIDI